MARNGFLHIKERVLTKDEGIEGHAHCPHLQFRSCIAAKKINNKHKTKKHRKSAIVSQTVITGQILLFLAAVCFGGNGGSQTALGMECVVTTACTRAGVYIAVHGLSKTIGTHLTTV